MQSSPRMQTRVACAKQEALKSMDEYRKGLQQRLADHEQELKSGSRPAGGASRESAPAIFCIYATYICHATLIALLFVCSLVPGLPQFVTLC